MHSSDPKNMLAASDGTASARIEAQKQWNTNPCGAIPGTSFDRGFFDRVEADRYRQQYWQQGYFDYRSFRGGRVLEIGVGLGTDLKQFARNGARCFGVDITDTHLRMTEMNFGLEGLDVDLRETDARSLPFPDNYFDCVYSFGVLHHIPDVEPVLAEVQRVLKPGGVLQIAVYHRYSVHTITLLLRGLASGSLFRLGMAGILATIEKGADGRTIKPYVRLYTRRGLSKVLASSGFKGINTRIQQVNFEGHKGLNRLRAYEEQLGWYVCAHATKHA